MPIIDSPPRRFLGANIKGTPAMAVGDVEHDLRELKRRTDVLVTQEFRWPWYWHALGKVLRVVAEGGWRSYPALAKGAVHPVKSAQAVIWRRRLWRAIDRRETLLHAGRANISEDRWLRAALLRDRTVTATTLATWALTTHNVVGGDGDHDSAQRKAILDHDLDVLERFLPQLLRTGWPVIGEVDANIHRGTEAFTRLQRIITQLGGTFHGPLGVEFLFTIPGDNGTSVVVDDEWIVPDAALRTDHEARGITFRLRRKVARLG